MEGICAEGITSRTISKAKMLAKTYNINNVYENIENLINNCPLDGLLILVSADQIYDVTKKLISTQIPLFIEKPPGLIPEQTAMLVKLANKYSTKNMVGYNRRYYSIFHKGIKIITDHGQLLGVTVEGHERFWKITNRAKSRNITDNWLYANSTHTIDLLRFFGGEINNLNSFKKSIKEKNGDQFVASMEFNSGTLGTYISHWHSPGGWSVTLYGEGVTVKFNPLEKAVWIDRDFNENEILQNESDINYKPGLFSQMEAFINMVKKNKLVWPGLDLSEALKTMELAQKISE